MKKLILQTAQNIFIDKPSLIIPTLLERICAWDDIDDYYYIEVTTLSPITVRLTNIPSGVDYDLHLYYGESWVAGSDNYGNADEEIHYMPSQTGRYYIRVYPYSGYSESPYTLQASFQ